MFIFDQISVYAELDLGWIFAVVCIGDSDIPLELNMYYA